MRKVTIVGLGLIGGSIGLALTHWRAENESRKGSLLIAGYDLSPEHLKQAEHMQAIDHIYTEASEAVKNAEMVIIATPVLMIRQVFSEISPWLQEGVIVTDTASTKTQVLQWAEELLPYHAHFIGGHPMAGGTGSLEDAQENLFATATYCIVSASRSSEQAIQALHKLIAMLGATPLEIDATTHDRYVAAVSHLPFLSSIALMETVAESPDWSKMSEMAGTGLRRATHLASGSTAMHHDIVMTNQAAIRFWLDVYMTKLQEIQHIMQGSECIEDETSVALFDLFNRAQEHKKHLEK